ncbi:MAG: rRNA maturation RNase YbeY [Candidatus Moranbacteria bacterium]|nr:rRNA maturation RNase YbeY [Candidatus Moranbacteria bacterium]
MDKEFFTILNKTKGKLPRLPFVSVKNKILGEKYDLSLSILTSREQRKINRIYRGLDETTNILSFVLSKKTGEITLDPIKIKKDAHLFNMSYDQFFLFLFIHGLLHLKGFEHSSKMEEQEEKYFKIFNPKK